jgi:hypothetical protein
VIGPRSVGAALKYRSLWLRRALLLGLGENPGLAIPAAIRRYLAAILGA